MKRIYVFILYFAVSCLVYFRAYGAHFLDDTISWMYFFKQDGWSTFYSSFHFTSLYYGHDVLYNLLYLFFGTYALPWFIVLMLVHAANAFCSYVFFKKLFERREVQNTEKIAIGGSVLFLLSPYQTENVVWGATLHYGVSMLLLWAGFYFYEKFLQHKKVIHLLMFYAMFMIALVTLEISLVFPGLFFIVFAFLWQNTFSIKHVWMSCRYIALPMAVIIVGYFLANNYVHGSFIGHYGDEHTKTLFTLQTPITMLQYFAKYLFYVHFLVYDKRDLLYSIINHPLILIVVAGLSILISWYVYTKHTELRKRLFLIWGLLMLALVVLIPVASMYFMYLNQVQNDRLGYFFSLFLFMLLAYLLSLATKKYFFIIVILLSIFNIFLLQDYTQRWKHASEIQKIAMDTFRWYDAEKVYVLNQPCYFEGVYVFRNDARMDRSLSVLKNIEMYGRIQEVAWANMQDLSNNITVEQMDSLTLKVTLNEWGRWFWVGDKGAYDYKTDFAEVDFDEWNHSYTVRFKMCPTVHEPVIYYTPQGWKEFHFE